MNVLFVLNFLYLQFAYYYDQGVLYHLILYIGTVVYFLYQH